LVRQLEEYVSENETAGFLRRDVLQGTAIAGLATFAPIKNLAAAPSETNEALAPQPTPMRGHDLNTSDILVEALIDWGATHVFGIVGDGINSIIEALRKRGDRIRYIGVRHEEAAALWRRASPSTPDALAFVSGRQVRARSI
jgi:Thiamine pyrophosphate enzyme, N-terminal TPP binding domain